MTLKPTAGMLAALALSTAVATSLAAAAGGDDALSRGDLGTPSLAQAAQRTVKIDASTKYINAAHYEVLHIVNDKGQSFVWKFDTLGEVGFPIKVIAPRGFEAGETRVYVTHPLSHRQSG